MPDDDDRWFEALAGEVKAAAGGDSATQGAALRKAIRARAVSNAGEVVLSDPRREAALIARARAAGLLPPETQTAPARSGRHPLRWVALAAVVACVALAVSLQLRTLEPTAVVRGNPAGPVQLKARDPLRLKQDLLRELNAAGVHATGYENLGLQGIDADLPQPLPAAVRGILERHAIPLPAGTVLQLQIGPETEP